MRVQLYFTISSKFPINYRLIILSYLKESIRSQSNTFYNTFFIENKRETKPYAFAAYFKNIQIKNDVIYADSLSVTVTTSNTEFMIYLINGCQQTREFSYKNINMTLIRCELLKEKSITQSKVWLKTISPILVESKDRKPVLFNHPQFEKELNFIVSNMVREIEGRSLYQPIKILKNNCRRVVIKEDFHQKQDKDLYFTANQGIFLLGGDSRDLMFCYNNGIGLRTGVGFGAVQMI